MAETQPGIAAAVIVSDGELLLIRRRVAEGALRWQFPAGQIESGETADAAAVRETLEEVGLVVRSVAPLVSVTIPSPVGGCTTSNALSSRGPRVWLPLTNSTPSRGVVDPLSSSAFPKVSSPQSKAVLT
jgi:8-oxo-dGTP pyrophosphatase MutT (NUDIX family)